MIRVALISVFIFCFSCLAFAGLPPAMTDMAYEDAIEQSTTQSAGLLIVKFTAEWCGPCKVMDRTTWSDDGVIEYLKEHGVTVIAVDVDDQPEIAKSNSINAMPTMVVFKNGSEFDRSVGMMKAEQLTEWIDKVLDGRSVAQEAADSFKDRLAKIDELGMQDRMMLARELVDRGDYERATQEYAWLWENIAMREPSMHGVRGSFMVSDMKRLADRYEPALIAFTALRDGLGAEVEKGKTNRQTLNDWLVLNIRLLDDTETVNAWIERTLEKPGGIQTLNREGYILSNWLLEQERWALAGQLLPSATSRANRMKSNAKLMSSQDERFPKDMREELQQIQTEQSITEVATLHTAYLAADRDHDAWTIVEEMRESLPESKLILAVCEKALGADLLHKGHCELVKVLQGIKFESLHERIDASGLCD